MTRYLPMLSRGAAVLIAVLISPLVSADDDEYAFDAERFGGGVLARDVDHATSIVGWQLSDRIYFGRRRGDIDDFGFVWRDGDTQWSLTESGFGWRRSVSLFAKNRPNP